MKTDPIITRKNRLLRLFHSKEIANAQALITPAIGAQIPIIQLRIEILNQLRIVLSEEAAFMINSMELRTNLLLPLSKNQSRIINSIPLTLDRPENL